MTLFELSVAVAIAVILVVLAVVSARTLITQTKVSRVKEEHRSLSRALQNYLLDYSALPVAKQGIACLTRPTAYMGSVPKDPFQNSGGYLYLMPNSHDMGSLVISTGPDGDFDLPPELWRFAAFQDVDENLRPDMPVDLFGAGTGDGPILSPELTEAGAAVLSTYLRLGRYDPAKGQDGDIIAVIRY